MSVTCKRPNGATDSLCLQKPRSAPQSAQRFLDAVTSGASAEEINILHGILKRDQSLIRDVDEAVRLLTMLQHNIHVSAATPAVAVRIRRILGVLREVVP